MQQFLHHESQHASVLALVGRPLDETGYSNVLCLPQHGLSLFFERIFSWIYIFCVLFSMPRFPHAPRQPCQPACLSACPGMARALATTLLLVIFNKSNCSSPFFATTEIVLLSRWFSSLPPPPWQRRRKGKKGRYYKKIVNFLTSLFSLLSAHISFDFIHFFFSNNSRP